MCHSISHDLKFLAGMRRIRLAIVRNTICNMMLSTLLSLGLATVFASPLYAAPDKFKPILPLPLSWTPVRVDLNNSNTKNVFQNKPASDKSVIAFKESIKKLSQNLSASDQAREINALRFSATKLLRFTA